MGLNGKDKMYSLQMNIYFSVVIRLTLMSDHAAKTLFTPLNLHKSNWRHWRWWTNVFVLWQGWSSAVSKYTRKAERRSTHQVCEPRAPRPRTKTAQTPHQQPIHRGVQGDRRRLHQRGRRWVNYHCYNYVNVGCYCVRVITLKLLIAVWLSKCSKNVNSELLFASLL